MEKLTISDNAAIEINMENDKVIMNWKGAIDTDNTNEVLGKYLYNFHNKCKENNITELRVNFYNSDFMNSSGIKNTITWLRDVSNDNKYKTIVEFDTAISWQDITFETFRQLIGNVIFVPKS